MRAVGNDEAMTCGPTVSVVPVPPCVARIPEKIIEKRGREGLDGRARHSSLSTSDTGSTNQELYKHVVARKNVLRMGNITTLAEVAESRRAFISLPEWRIFNSLHSPFLSFGSSFSCVPRWSIHSELLLYCPGSVISRFTRLRRLSDLVENAAVY